VTEDVRERGAESRVENEFAASLDDRSKEEVGKCDSLSDKEGVV